MLHGFLDVGDGWQEAQGIEFRPIVVAIERIERVARGEANGAQEAEVQAKKRVCAEGLMLGLFFYVRREAV